MHGPRRPADIFLLACVLVTTANYASAFPGILHPPPPKPVEAEHSAAAPAPDPADEAAPGRVDDGRTIMLDGRGPIALAAWHRNGSLWLLVPEADAELRLDIGATLNDLNEYPIEGGRLLALANVPPGRGEIERVGAGWRLRPERPARSQDTVLTLDAAIGAGTSSGRPAPVTIVDPLVGDELIVVPFVEPARGTRAGTFEVQSLETLQGMVLRPRIDGITVTDLMSGTDQPEHAGRAQPGDASLAIMADVGDLPAPPSAPAATHSDEAMPVAAPSPADGLEPQTVAAARGAQVEEPSRRYVARPLFAEYADADEATLREAERRLFAELTAVADEGDRAELARRLAVLRLGLVQPRAAIDALRLGQASDEATVPIRAIAAELERLAGGESIQAQAREVSSPTLDRPFATLDDQEERFWHGLALAAGPEDTAAGPLLDAAPAVLSSLPGPLRARLLPAVIESALAAGRAPLAFAVLEEAKNGAGQDRGWLPPMVRDRLRYLEALALYRDGALQEARTVLGDLGEIGSWAVATRARVLDVDIRAGLGELAPVDVAEALAAQRGLWRGHPDELALLERLGELQATAEATRPSALATWQELLDRATADGPRERAFSRLQDSLRPAIAALLERGRPAHALVLARRYPELIEPSSPVVASAGNGIAIQDGSVSDGLADRSLLTTIADKLAGSGLAGVASGLAGDARTTQADAAQDGWLALEQAWRDRRWGKLALLAGDRLSENGDAPDPTALLWLATALASASDDAAMARLTEYIETSGIAGADRRILELLMARVHDIAAPATPIGTPS